jgi:hypothetical protein
MKFKTESGSEYEVNTDKKEIRRLSGNADPTLRQGRDGDWKSYEDISEIVVGRSVIVFHTKNTSLFSGSPKYAIPGTITSRVTNIQK